MSGMLVVHRDRRELGTNGIPNMPGKPHSLTLPVTCLFLCSQRIYLKCSSGLTVGSQGFLLQGPQWTLSPTKVWVDRVLSLTPSLLGLQTEAKGAEVSTDHLKLFLSRRRWQVSLSGPRLRPFHTNFLPQSFFFNGETPPQPPPPFPA